MSKAPPAVAASMTWEQVLRWRVHRQLLAAERGTDLVDIVRRLAGVHAQVAASAVTAIRLRAGPAAAVTPDAVESALATDRRLVKTWAARGTLHLLPADDLPTWVAVASLRGIETSGAWLRYHQLTADQVRDVLAAIAEVLDATPLTRPQLADRIIAATGHQDLRDRLTQGFGALLKPAAAYGLLCFGPPQGRNVTFVAPRRWLPGWSEVDPERALETLVLAHLDAYGPADPAEFARWFALKPSLVEPAFARPGARLGRAGRSPVRGPARSAGRAARPARRVNRPPATGLRPVRGWRPAHLDAVMAGGERSQVSRPQGWISPTLVVDGRIAGTWEATGGKADELAVTVVPFGPLSRSVRTGVARAADRLAAATDASQMRLDVSPRTGV